MSIHHSPTILFADVETLPPHPLEEAKQKMDRIPSFTTSCCGRKITVNHEKIRELYSIIQEALARIKGSLGKTPSFGSLEIFDNTEDPVHVTSKGKLCKAALEEHKDTLEEAQQRLLLDTAKKTVLATCTILNSPDFQETLKKLDDGIMNLFFTEVKEFTLNTFLHVYRLEGGEAALAFMEECFSNSSSIKSATYSLQKQAFLRFIAHLLHFQDIAILKKVLHSKALPFSIHTFVHESYVNALVKGGQFPEALEAVIAAKSSISPSQRLTIALTLTEAFLKAEDFERAARSLDFAKNTLALISSRDALRAAKELDIKHKEYTDALRAYKLQADPAGSALEEIFRAEESFKKTNMALGIKEFTEEQKAVIDHLSAKYNKAAIAIAPFAATVREKRNNVKTFASLYEQISPVFYKEDVAKMQAKIDALEAMLLSKCPPKEKAPTTSLDSILPAGPKRLSINYDTGWGHALEIRGTAPGMSWDRGLALTWQEGNVWSADLDSLPSDAEYKIVLVLNKGTPEEKIIWENYPSNRKGSDPLRIESISFTR